MDNTTTYTIKICDDKYFITFGVSKNAHEIGIYFMSDNVLYQIETNITEDIAEMYLDDIINRIADICVKNNMQYESFHNHLFGMNATKSKDIEQRIKNIIVKY